MPKDYPCRYAMIKCVGSPKRSSTANWTNDNVLRVGVLLTRDPDSDPTMRLSSHDFGSPDEAISLLMEMPRSDQPIYIFGHSIGTDIRLISLFRHVTAGRFTLMPPASMPGSGRYKSPMLAIDGHPFLLRLFRNDGQIFLFYDVFNWFPKTVGTIAGWIGMDEPRIPDTEATADAYADYCNHYCRVLEEAMCRLWGWMQIQRLPSFSPTPASAAIQLWRMRYAKSRLKTKHDADDVSLDRHAYYAGFNEPFRVGQYGGPLYQLDVNGLYPRVMRDNPFPAELIASGDFDGATLGRCKIDPRNSTAEVWIKSDTVPYPVRGSDRTLWVRGRVRTVLCGPELERAMASDHVVRLGRWSSYRMESLFDGFVADLWRERRRAQQRKDKQIDTATKLMLNGLYGKFGQRDGQWVDEGEIMRPGLYAGGKVIGDEASKDVDARVINGRFFTRRRSEEHKDSFVPIAAWTSSYARVYMDDLIDRFGREHVLYQCIDSVLCTGEFLGQAQLGGVVNTGELGHLKLEDEFKWVDIRAQNHVLHDHGSKLAGIKSGSVALAGDIYQVRESESLHASLSRGQVSAVSTRETLKRASSAYSRRRVLADGTTQPWAVENWGLSPAKQSSLPADYARRGREKVERVT